jgi:hypothetical protein
MDDEVSPANETVGHCLDAVKQAGSQKTQEFGNT